jgi:hypothetical protein
VMLKIRGISIVENFLTSVNRFGHGLTQIYGLPHFARAFSHLKTRNRLQQYIRPIVARLALAPMTFARQIPIS